MNHDLKALRERAGMNKSEWAKALGVTHPTIIRWESGVLNPKAGFVIAMRAIAAEADAASVTAKGAAA